MRKCLADEFSNLYVFHLRGNARTSGERRRKEKDNVFGQGTRTPIAISILVKNPENQTQGQIYFYDIGDYLSQKDKLEIIEELGSIQGINEQHTWQSIVPDSFGDWLNQRDPNFDKYISLGDRSNPNASLFLSYCNGVQTNRDPWCYGSSRLKVKNNMVKMIGFYNQQRQGIYPKITGLPNPDKKKKIDQLIDTQHSLISWTRGLKTRLSRNENIVYCDKSFSLGLYRPYFKQNIYFDRSVNEYVNKIPEYFSLGANKIICITGTSSTKDFSSLITDIIPDVQLFANGQCFPLYLYEKAEPDTGLFAQEGVEAEYQRRDAITDEAMDHFKEAYPELSVNKEDIFYYIYGLLHSEDYREKYADNLSKQLPRIPRVKAAKDFTAFATAGRELAQWHLNYEIISLNTAAKLTGKTKGLAITANGVTGGQDADFYVTKMKFGKKKDAETGKSVDDKTTVIYNSGITIENIPEEAYDYIVNGKSALEWVMERQSVTTDKKSGITNDANDWAIETMNNPRYPLELFLRVINVSLRTQEIVRGLPPLRILKAIP